MDDLKLEIRQLKLDLGIIKKEPCSQAEEKEFAKLKKSGVPLPDDVYGEVGSSFSNCHFRFTETTLSEQEIKDLMQLRQTRYLESIKNCAYFFVTIAVISIVISFFTLFGYMR